MQLVYNDWFHFEKEDFMNNITELKDFLSHLTASNFWMLHLFTIVFVTSCFQFLVGRLCNKIEHKTKQTNIFYDKALVVAIKAPLVFMVWLLGLSMAADIVLDHNSSLTIFTYLPELKKLGFVFAIGWTAIRFIQNVEDAYILSKTQQEKEVDKTLVHALAQLVTISVVITCGLVVMQIFGLPISGLLAFGGLGGAAVALASKDMVANFFGSLVIYMDSPFKVGDWIRSPDKQIEGVVEFIGWRVTRIRTFEKRPLYVPNGIFLTISVENPSRMTNRRINTVIGIRYQDADKIDVITTEVREMLRQHQEIDQKQIIMVNFVEYGHSSLNFRVYAFTKTINWVRFQEVQHEVFMKILGIIEHHGAQCAFPTQTLFLQQENQTVEHLSAVGQS